MVAEVVEVGSVGKQDLVVQEMKVDCAGIVGKENNVGKDVDRPDGMFDFHEHILTNFEQVGFGLAEETKSSKAQAHSMNFEQGIDNLEKIVAQGLETYLENVVVMVFSMTEGKETPCFGFLPLELLVIPSTWNIHQSYDILHTTHKSEHYLKDILSMDVSSYIQDRKLIELDLVDLVVLVFYQFLILLVVSLKYSE